MWCKSVLALALPVFVIDKTSVGKMALPAGAGAGACFFNTVKDAVFAACKVSVDLNDDVGGTLAFCPVIPPRLPEASPCLALRPTGYSVNNCNFQGLHASDVGVWTNGVSAQQPVVRCLSLRFHGAGHLCSPL